MRNLLFLLLVCSLAPAARAATILPNAAHALILSSPVADTSSPAPTKHRKPLYEKGHGTLGFIFGVVFLWFGYAGVCIFTRNRTQRRKALRGMLTAIAIALIALPIAIKGN